MVIKQSNVGYWKVYRVTMCAVVSRDELEFNRECREAIVRITEASVVLREAISNLGMVIVDSGKSLWDCAVKLSEHEGVLRGNFDE